jgi:hypothetical protein
MSPQVEDGQDPAPSEEELAAGAELDARLIAAAVAARENNASESFSDTLDRHWFVGVENVDNQASVLIQVRKGEMIAETYLRTDVFTPNAADQAVQDLKGKVN